MELFHNGADTAASGTHAGAHRIHALNGCADCHLGTGAGLTGDVADLHLTGGDFGSLQLEQTAHQVGMGAGYINIGAAGGHPGLQNINTDLVALGIGLAGDLLADTQHSVMPLVALTHGDQHITAGIHTGNRAGEQLLSLVGIALVDHATLSFTNALNDHLLGSLGSNAAELLHIHRDGDGIAHLNIGIVVSGGIDVHFQGGVGQLVHHGLDLEHEDTLLGDVDHHIFSGHITVILPVLPVGIGQSLLQTLKHILHGNALSLFQLPKGGVDLHAIDLVSFRLLLGSCISCHFSFLQSEFNTQADQCHLGFFKGYGFLAAFHGDPAFFIATKDAGEFLQTVVGAVELDHDRAAHEPLKICRTLQRPLQTGGADLKMIGFLDGILLIQNRVHCAGNGFTVGDIHTAILFDVQPQKPLGALTDIFHIPEAAAVLLHHRFCKGFHLFGDLQKFSLISQKERGDAPLFRIVYVRLPVL